MPAKGYVFDGVKWRGLQGIGDEDVPLDPFILGSTKPSAANTGLTGATPTVITAADTVYNTDQTVSDTRFEGNVRTENASVTFDNCDFAGKNVPTGNHFCRALYTTPNAAKVTTFNRCKFYPRYWDAADGADGPRGGIMGTKMVINRCDISGLTDGLGFAAQSATPTDITLTGNYIHDLWFTSPDSEHTSDGSHADGAQGHQFLQNLTIRGNTIEGIVLDTLANSQAQYPPVYSGSTLIDGNGWYNDYFSQWNGIYAYPLWATSALLFGRSGTGGGLTNVVIDQNWLDGGGYAMININPGYTNANSSGIQITNNRIGARNRDGYVLICSSSLTSALTFTGNVYEATGTPANTRRNG